MLKRDALNHQADILEAFLMCLNFAFVCYSLLISDPDGIPS